MKAKAIEKTKIEDVVSQAERQANIELLRIVATIFILVYHFCVHGAISEIYVHTTNKITSFFLYTEGQVGVNIFFLITGYFMINSKMKIKKVIKFALQVSFFSGLIALYAMYQTKQDFNPELIRAYFMPITSNIYWFPTCYVGIYLLSPFLNKLILALGKDGCKKALILCTIFWSILPMVFNIYFLTSEFHFGIFFYIIGAYIRLYNFDFKNNKTAKLISIFHPICMFALCILITIMNKKFGTNINKDKCICYYSVFSIIGAIGYFLTFKNMTIKPSKLIAYFSKLSFATYLLTDHPMYRRYFWFLDCRTDLYKNAPLPIFLLNALLCVVGIYLLTAVIEFIRVNLLEKLILEKLIFKIKIFNKYLNKVDEGLNSL